MEKLSRKIPASSYDSTDLVFTSPRTAIPNTIIRGDVELLLNTFMAQEQHTFHSFETVWKQLNFDHIHFTCLLKDYRQVLMNALYENVFDHFAINIDQMKFGVIYALYFLFMTQPTTWPIHSIRVDQVRWTMLFDFYIYCCQLGSKEGAQAAMIFRQMKDETMAFTFVVDHKFDTLNLLEKKEKEPSLDIIEGCRQVELRKFSDDVTSTCYDTTASDFRSLSQQYQKAKQRACMTPQATLATQRWIKETMNINETNQKRLQNVMLKSVLTMKDVTFGELVNEAGRKMWAARSQFNLTDIDVMQPHYVPTRNTGNRPQTEGAQQEDPLDDSQEEGS